MRYVHKPIEVEAVMWDGDNLDKMKELVGSTGRVTIRGNGDLFFYRFDGNQYILKEGDWLIKRNSGCVYSCTADSFETNYEALARQKEEQPAEKHATLFFDGGSRGNPGPGGYGYCLEVDGEKIVHGGFLRQCTNNEAEYTGLIAGLRHAVSERIAHLEVLGDSKLVIEQMNGNWKVKAQNLKDLHASAVGMIPNFQSISFAHTYRDGNMIADAAYNEAIDRELRKG